MSLRFITAHALAFPREPGEDRVDVLEHEGALVAVVADGAGGLSGGARAAELLVELVRESVASSTVDPRRAETWTELLARVDLFLEADPVAGETTAVVVAITEDQVVGASCGDSGAWVIHPDGGIDDLTIHQHRRLRVGSGRARPVAFSRPLFAGTLLVATDGLFNYARPEKIAAVALQEDLDGAARELVQLVRLPGGGLQDDVGVVTVRGAVASAHDNRGSAAK